MKSIKQQYIDLKEGKMSQANFMRNLRMTIPQHVTNVTSFGDAVRILKNKGIINESFNPAQDAENAKYKSPMDRMYNSDDYVKAQKDEKGSDDDAEFDAILKQLEDEMGGEEAVKGQYDVNEVELTAKQIVDKYNEMFGKNAQTTFKDVAKALGVDEERVAVALGLTGLGFNENVNENALNLTVRQVVDKFEELLSKNPNAKVEDLAKTLNTTPHELAKIIGIPDLYSAKPAMNETKEAVNPNKIHPQEYTMGMKYELQCFNGDKKKAEKAVLKNLTKDSFYYTVLKLSGNDVHKEKVTKPEVVKKKKVVKPELVDKANGMAKVKMPKTVKEAMEIDATGNLNNKPELNNTPDEQRLAKLLSQYPSVVAALAKVKENGEWDGFFDTILNDTSITNASKSSIRAAFQKALDQTKGSTFTSSNVANKVFSSPQQTGLSKSFEKGELGEADVPQDDKVEAELASALNQQPTLKRILQKVDLPQEVNGTVKAILDRTNLKNIPDQIILAALRKVLNDQPGPSFTSQYAVNKNVGKPLPDLKEKLTALVREMLAEEAPSKKTAASEITAKAVDYIDDYNEGESKEYKKSQLENVFDSYEDKVGRRFDDSVFEDVIDMLKAKGYTMSIKEFYDGRDNLDAENEVN
jgi:hypothetical protein